MTGLGGQAHLSLLAALTCAPGFCPLGCRRPSKLPSNERPLQSLPLRRSATFYPWRGLVCFCRLCCLLASPACGWGCSLRPQISSRVRAIRIIFIHVPASWMSHVHLSGVAFWAAIGSPSIPGSPGMMAQALAPTGALMALLSYGPAPSGANPWGAWWVWDARLTSELIPALPLYRLPGPGRRHRRSPPEPTRPGSSAPGRRGQRPHHLFLGQMVEHPCTRGVGEPHQVADHGLHHALGHAPDGALFLDVFHRRRADAGAHHRPGGNARPTGSGSARRRRK